MIRPPSNQRPRKLENIVDETGNVGCTSDCGKQSVKDIDMEPQNSFVAMS